MKKKRQAAVLALLLLALSGCTGAEEPEAAVELSRATIGTSGRTCSGHFSTTFWASLWRRESSSLCWSGS